MHGNLQYYLSPGECVPDYFPAYSYKPRWNKLAKEPHLSDPSLQIHQQSLLIYGPGYFSGQVIVLHFHHIVRLYLS